MIVLTNGECRLSFQYQRKAILQNLIIIAVSPSHKLPLKYINCIILNRIRPVVDKLLRPNQNGFRVGRSTSAHILALRRIVEELKNHKKEVVISFIDFRKAFDSINRDHMFQIFQAHGIPETLVNNAIKIP